MTDEADALADDLAAGGFPRMPGEWWDDDDDDDVDSGVPGTRLAKRLHCAADPGRAVNLHVRVAGSPWARAAVLFRDWLRANGDERDAYAAVKQQAQGVGIEEYGGQGPVDPRGAGPGRGRPPSGPPDHAP
jgi:dephospho-CoA kinase